MTTTDSFATEVSSSSPLVYTEIKLGVEMVFTHLVGNFTNSYKEKPNNPCDVDPENDQPFKIACEYFIVLYYHQILDLIFLSTSFLFN